MCAYSCPPRACILPLLLAHASCPILLAQLPHFRASHIVTGMHGAGYANIIFLAPGSVVAELCPMGYCTDSYRRISDRLDLHYLRWTNSDPAHAKDGFDTIVEPREFTTLMERAVKALRAGGSTGAPPRSAAS